MDGETPTFDEQLKNNPDYQSEFDRRVAKALETQKAKLNADFETKLSATKTEAEKLAAMSAEEKLKHEHETREAQLKQRELEITKRELAATAKDELASKGLPLSLADVLDYSSADSVASSIAAVEKSFQEAVKNAVDEKLKSTGSTTKKAPPPKGQLTREDLKKMSQKEIDALDWSEVQEILKRG